jgi:hypothetical protein
MGSIPATITLSISPTLSVSALRTALPTV